jgi:signal transduction histidine kinase
MKLKSSIFIKLLAVILPLVCVPIATVGYFSVAASVERVNRLVRQEQILKLEAAAQRIDNLFANCRIDLETLSRLPTLEDYHLARSFRLEAEAGFNRDNIAKIFNDFRLRTPHYYRIVLLDADARELVEVGADGITPEPGQGGDYEFVVRIGALADGEAYFSPVVRAVGREGYVIRAVRPFFTGLGERAGTVMIELDFERIMQFVGSIQVGEEGYGFLIDGEGRAIAHPFYAPYEFGPEKYPDKSVADLTEAMLSGETGWKNYFFEGKEKVAAYAPIPSMGWSMAVTIPIEEFRAEAQAVRTRVIQVVILALILTIAGVSILSYNLLRPVRRLVEATDRLARGELDSEIPVRSGDELGELTQSFNRMVRNLERTRDELVRSEKLISLGRLSAGVAHEIRNPLNAMKGAIVHLRRRRAGDELIDEFTSLVLEEIDRLNRFVTDFLYFARQSPPRPVPTDLNRLVRSTRSLFDEQAREKGIMFHSNLDPDLPPAPVDPYQMEQVLVNVIVNALEAMPHGGGVTVSTSVLHTGEADDRRWVRIAIHDSGEGIPDEAAKSVFDPFFTTKESGTGLGLPISLGIVESHGGVFRIESRDGQGATVFIELPLPRNKER